MYKLIIVILIIACTFYGCHADIDNNSHKTEIEKNGNISRNNEIIESVWENNGDFIEIGKFNNIELFNKLPNDESINENEYYFSGKYSIIDNDLIHVVIKIEVSEVPDNIQSRFSKNGTALKIYSSLHGIESYKLFWGDTEYKYKGKEY